MTYKELELICKVLRQVHVINPEDIESIETTCDGSIVRLHPIHVKPVDIEWAKNPYAYSFDYSAVPRRLGLTGGFIVDEGKRKGAYTPPSAKYRKFAKLIKKVIFQDGVTVILWKSGDKTVVKAQEGEPIDYEKGFAMAIAKKFFGNEGNYYEAFKQFLPEEAVEEKGKSASVNMDDMWIKRLEKDREELKSRRLYWVPESEEYAKITNELVEVEKMLDTLKNEEEEPTID